MRPGSSRSRGAMAGIVYRLIRLNRRLSGHRLKFAAALAAHTLGLRHLYVQIDPVWACNLRCRMCYFSSPYGMDGLGEKFSRVDLERLADLFFPRALRLVVGCGAEPTIHPDYLWLLRHAAESGIPETSLVTNAQLIGPGEAREIAETASEVIISTHGVTRESYEELMPGGSYDRFLSALGCLDEARAGLPSSSTEVRINYTVCGRNLEELGGFFDAFGQYGIRTLQVRAMKSFGGELAESDLGQSLDLYGKTLEKLRHECSERGVSLIANVEDPTYAATSGSGLVLEAVRRWITPRCVWRDDFDWRNETYTGYCRRTGWKRHLVSRILSSRKKLLAELSSGTRARDDFLT